MSTLFCPLKYAAFWPGNDKIYKPLVIFFIDIYDDYFNRYMN